MLPITSTMDLVKIWANLLSNSNSSLCSIPTTYFMQGVQVFAYANDATSLKSDENASNQTNNEIQLDDEASNNSQDEYAGAHSEPNSNSGGDGETCTFKKRTRRIQRIRYSREEYKCTMCTYTCTTEKAFLKHLRGCESGKDEDKNSTEPILSCPICGKDRNGEQSILMHMQKHKDNKYFCCDLCKFRTLQLKKVIQHRRMHTGEKPHLCPFCTYRSARRDNLRSHVRRVHKKENLTCDTFTPRSMILAPSKAKTADTE